MPPGIDGYILTGGKASRMGGLAKAEIELGGEAFATRIAKQLAPVVDNVCTVGKRIADTSMQNVEDEDALRRSSMGGLYTALKHARSRWIIAAACDMPFVTSELFAALIEELSGEHGAVVPVASGGVLQPLCAVYNVGTCTPHFRSAIERGELSVVRLLPLLGVKYVGFDRFDGLSGSGRFFWNINTPEELAAARAVISADR